MGRKKTPDPEKCGFVKFSTSQLCNVLLRSKEDIILSKLDWAKDSLSQRQLSDVQNLIASGCDMAYLREWSVKLNLTDMLTRVSP